MLKILIFLSLQISSLAFAVTPETWYFGASYYAQESLSKSTTSVDGTGAGLGQAHYPLSVAYPTTFWGIPLMPKLDYTLLPRSNTGETTKSTMLILSMPYYSNISESWDYSFGLAFLVNQIKGEGGIKVLNNGGSTANFAVPGDTSTSIVAAVQGGIAYNYSAMRFELGTYLQGLLSNERRTFDVYLSFQYKL